MSLKNLPRLSGAEFKYSENGKTKTKDEYIKELEYWYELFVDYKNFTAKETLEKDMKILNRDWEIRKLKKELENGKKIKKDN